MDYQQALSALPEEEKAKLRGLYKKYAFLSPQGRLRAIWFEHLKLNK